MKIPPGEIKYRRKIGSYKGRALFGIGTVGGLHIVAASSPGGGDMELLGCGSHGLLARHLAERHDGVIFDELSKSDPSCFGTLLDEYATITSELRKMQGF